MWDQLVATRLDAKQHWSISKCQKHVPTPDRKLFFANMGNILLFYVNKQILIFQYFFILSEPSAQDNCDCFKKLFGISHTIARLSLRVYALAFVHYFVDLRNSNCYCLLTMNRRICCRKNCVVFLQIDIHDHLYLLLFDHSIKTYILCKKTIEMQKFTIALDRNSSVVNFRFVTPLKSKLKTAISGCVSLLPIFYISRSL